MFNPAAFGYDPEKLKQIQEVTQHIRAEVRRSGRQGQFRVIFTSDGDPQAAQVIPGLVHRFTDSLCQELYVVFAMHGKMVDVE